MARPYTNPLDESEPMPWLKERPTPSEDTVTYCIWLSQRDVTDQATAEQIVTDITGQLLVYCKDYIWQKEPFRLTVKKEKEGYCLVGSTIFGDCIDDEWFIVFLLREISQQHLDAVVEIRDNDGEFLLIEAAAYLPGWLEPDTSEHRVFIYRGELHIIPLDIADQNTVPSIAMALDAILQRYPKAAQQNIHRARCIVPRPNCPAVEAFYTRDPIGMKACYQMARFPPSSSVMVSIPFTRALYAQLVHQQFHPPKSFRLPPPSSSDFKAAELGMKLACGFEILCSTGNLAALIMRIQPLMIQIISNILDLSITNDQHWKQFTNKLKNTGYYQNEIDGSQLYKELDIKAKEYYLRNKRASDNYESSTEWALSRIHTLLQLPIISEDIIKMNHPDNEDTDTWLNIDHSEFDQMLQMKNSRLMRLDSEDEEGDDDDDDDSVDGDELGRIVQSFREFVDQDETGLQGAEFPSERVLGEEDDIELDKEGTIITTNTESLGSIQLDSSKFFELLKHYLSLMNTEYICIYIIGIDASKTSIEKKALIVEQDDTVDLVGEKELEEEFEAAMEAMDAELAATTLAQSFSRATDVNDSDQHDQSTNTVTTIQQNDNDNDNDDDDNRNEPLAALDLDYNLVENLLASFESQQGLAGPASNILGRLGIKLLVKCKSSKSNNSTKLDD
ncbi:SGT1 protein-domain-containing protein, partial [Syncephalis fuscata]